MRNELDNIVNTNKPVIWFRQYNSRTRPVLRSLALEDKTRLDSNTVDLEYCRVYILEGFHKIFHKCKFRTIHSLSRSKHRHPRQECSLRYRCIDKCCFVVNTLRWGHIGSYSRMKVCAYTGTSPSATRGSVCVSFLRVFAEWDSLTFCRALCRICKESINITKTDYLLRHTKHQKQRSLVFITNIVPYLSKGDQKGTMSTQLLFKIPESCSVSGII